MNTRLNKLQIQSKVSLAAPTTRIAERDTMPYAVATNMLSKFALRQTGADRRMYGRAREIHHVSTLEKKPVETKLAARMRAATLLQIGKWSKRSRIRRGECQLAFEVIREKQGARWAAMRRALEVRVQQLDLIHDACSEEIERRKFCCSGAA